MIVKTTTDDNLKIEIEVEVDEHYPDEGVHTFQTHGFELIGPDGELWTETHLKNTDGKNGESCPYVYGDTLDSFLEEIGVSDFILDDLNYNYCPQDYFDEDAGRER